MHAVRENALDARLNAIFASDPVAMADPFPVFNEVRETAPVYWFDSAVLLTRHRDVTALLQDNAVKYSRAQVEYSPRAMAARATLTEAQRQAYDEVTAIEGLQVVRTDPPQHDRLRRIASRAFTPRQVARLEQSIADYTEELVDGLGASDTVDLSGFCYTLPLMVIAELLGVPQSDRDLIHGWTVKIARNKGGDIRPDALMDAHAAHGELRDYVVAILDRHRRCPAGDLMSALVGAEHDERLSTDELAAMFTVLIFAGHETTSNLIAVGVSELLRRRDQWARLGVDRAGCIAAVDELIRFISPVQWVNRIAITDIEIDEETVPAGTTVYAMLAAANRDPAVFDDPDRLDISRPNSAKTVGFGLGPHFCLGSALARMEAAAAFSTLATRFPHAQLTTEELTWRGAAMIRGLAELPVRLVS